jgi:ABC-type Mn2+/Zn2+ transport system ATPase subunit
VKWTFLKIKDVLQSASYWNSMHPFEDQMNPSQSLGNKQLSVYNVFPNHMIYSSCREIHLIGSSGAGKSTYLKQKIQEFRNEGYNPKSWIYLDQKVQIPKLHEMSLHEYLLKDISNTNIYQLLHYADLLDLSSIINMNSLSQRIPHLSGGEEKRMVLLKNCLPFLIDGEDTRILFNDEITSGLDNENWLRVRRFLHELKTRNLFLITIDHHFIENTEDDIIKIDITSLLSAKS